jgi:PAS domain S-box-containing protein
MRKTPRARLIAYGVAVLAPAVTVVMRWIIVQYGPSERALYISFVPAVMIAAYLGGLWPGLLATLLSVGVLDYFFIDPRGSFFIQTNAEDWSGLITFVLVGTIISGLSEFLHRSRRRIAASERRYAVTLSSIGDAVMATDDQSRVTFLNPCAEALTGWPQSDAVGRPLAEVFHIVNEQTRQRVEDPGAKVLRLGAVVGLANHTALLARDGRETPIDDCGAPIIDDRGGIRGVVLVFRDVTQRRRADEAEALGRANARLEMAVRGSNLAIWECDMPDGIIENSHPTFINVWESLGYDPPTSPTDFASAFAVMVHPDDHERARRESQEYLASDRRDYESEFRVRHKDGSDRWRLSRGVALRDPEGKPVRFIGSIVDITDLKRAEEAVRQSERRFRTFVDHATDAFFLFDDRNVVLDANRQACQSLGYTRDELLGMTPLDFDPDVTRARLEEMERKLDDGKLMAFETRHRRKDGTVFPVEVRGQAFWEGGGRFVVALARDITERKRAEAALRQAKEAAEAANRSKDEFLANVSHEIRTPMNAILGMTELALDTPLTDDQRQCLQTVKSAADNLLGILNDLLDFAKIEAGKLELNLADFSLRTVMSDTLRALALRAHTQGLELIYHVQPEAPNALVGDATRLRQVLLNLVGNAIKFTEQGEVVVSVGLDMGPMGPMSDPRGTHLRFTVRDTGIGIPLDKQESIFRAFEQEDASTTRKFGGTGLGLTIASQLVALMGGKIRVDSEPGRGSTFAFTARFGLQPHAAEPTAAQPPVLLRSLPVLIVDDNDTNRHILQQWLCAWQMEAEAVADAASAMDALWHRAANGRPFALVLLDARMPNRDGLTLAALIRERAELFATRLILLTSGDRPGDPARYRELRIDAHLLKPVRQEELLETIHRVMSRPSGNGPATGRPAPAREPAAAPDPAAPPLHILVAEDDEFSARLLDQMLGRRGCRVRLARNGQEALALAEEGVFDVLLLDIHMPGLDGFKVVEAIREKERAAGGHLPVIALTARSRKEDRERCLAAGMDDFLTKPVSTAALLAAIDRLAPTPSVSQPAQADAGERGSLLDPVAVLTACGDDADGLRRMCQDFQTYAPARLAEVGDALRDRDAPRLRQAAHKFCALLFAFSPAAGNVASDLEDRATQGQLDDAQPLADRLQTMTQDLLRLASGLSLETLRRQAGRAIEA